MSKFELFHLRAGDLKLANLAGLVDETLLVVEPQASLLGDTGIKKIAKLRADNTVMKTEMDRSHSSLFTGPIKQANDVCDATIEDIKRSVKTGNMSTVAAKASAGTILDHFMKPFWDVNKQPLLSQISMTGEMLVRYSADTALQQAAQTLAIADLFAALPTQNATLLNLYNQRLAESVADLPAASDLRDIVAADYNAVCDLAARAVNTEPVQDALVKLFNGVNDIRRKYSALSPAKINIAEAVTEPLSSQTYTGKAITPIPVMYYDGEELVFAVDFSVTYKNNVEVGEATVVMHGKGRFNGQHTRKFNIVRQEEAEN
ncbi:MAG: DUF6261 family protein [Prevotellaceae bacterium]|jgi:hypothetical protein|nr:DUF6261 family protein [Prevotellaceae bacterium]